jgi:hypothetical protein
VSPICAVDYSTNEQRNERPARLLGSCPE